MSHSTVHCLLLDQELKFYSAGFLIEKLAVVSCDIAVLPCIASGGLGAGLISGRPHVGLPPTHSQLFQGNWFSFLWGLITPSSFHALLEFFLHCYNCYKDLLKVFLFLPGHGSSVVCCIRNADHSKSDWNLLSVPVWRLTAQMCYHFALSWLLNPSVQLLVTSDGSGCHGYSLRTQLDSLPVFIFLIWCLSRGSQK